MERICSGTPQSRPSTLKAVLWSLPFSLCKSPFPSFLFLGLVKYLQHTCFRAQFLLHCTGCLLNMEFLRINFKVASIQKKGVTEFICCNLDFYRLSPHNYQHHISSHLVSHHCLTVFLHLVPPRNQEPRTTWFLPGTKNRVALRTASLKEIPRSRSLKVSLRTYIGCT